MEASASQMHDDGAEAVRRLEHRYRTIAADRMAGLPIMNLALGVTAVGVCAWQGQWLTALVTPWFLNLVMLPAPPSAELDGGSGPVKVGAKQIVALPGGQFEFIGSHDDELGPYSMCSLFSPVLEFADHETAVATAEAALSAVMEDAGAETLDDDMVRIWRGEKPDPTAAMTEVSVDFNDKSPANSEPLPDLSRRGLLFGRAHGDAT